MSRTNARWLTATWVRISETWKKQDAERKRVLGQILLRRIHQQVGEQDNTDAAMEAIIDVHANSIADLPLHELPTMEDSGYSSFGGSSQVATSAMDANRTEGSPEPVVSPGAAESAYEVS